MEPQASGQSAAQGVADEGGQATPSAQAAGDANASARSSVTLDEERKAMKELWKLYTESVLPVEKLCFFDHFRQHPITEQEFLAKPQVLLLGQYSVGKTSMIKWLTGSNSTFFNIGPDPTTDKFMAILHGSRDSTPIGGQTATCLEEAPYQGLSVFGCDFLNSFQALSLNSDVLKHITFIDTPGVLHGNDALRSYNFASVCEWLAERVDLILVMFDAHKLDISEEFKKVLEVLRPHSDKVRCLLNKADHLDLADLLRVYGSLNWNVAKVMQSPEAIDVFVSSFWEREYVKCKEHWDLFDRDKRRLREELHRLPNHTVLRRNNTIVERMRRVRANYCILSFIRARIPVHISILKSEDRLRAWLKEHLEQLLKEAQRHHRLSGGDMPDLQEFRESLETLDGIWRLPVFDSEVMDEIKQAIDIEVPKVLTKIAGISAGEMAFTDGLGTSAASPGYFSRIRGLVGGWTPAPQRRRT